MGLLVECIDETKTLHENDIALVRQLLETAAKAEKLDDKAEVSITFVDNDKIRELNHRYRGKDSTTDVLSFALEEMGEQEIDIVGEKLPRLLGDIVISVPKAREQAKEYGHTFERELGFLAVHGFLHLLGYDHLTENDEKEMFSKQKGILDECGLQR